MLAGGSGKARGDATHLVIDCLPEVAREPWLRECRTELFPDVLTAWTEEPLGEA